jgi:hypothetical protein
MAAQASPTLPAAPTARTNYPSRLNPHPRGDDDKVAAAAAEGAIA